MSLTYAQLTAAVEAYLEDDGTTFTDNLDTCIQTAETRILYEVQLPAFQSTSTGNLVNGTRLLTMPSGFLSVYAFAVNDGTSYEYLLPKDASFIRSAYPTGSSGVPRYYAVYSENEIVLAPTPNSTYAYEMYFYKAPESIVTANTTWLGDNAEDALLYGTLVEAYAFLKGDADLWQGYKMLYDRSIARLKNYGDAITQRDDYRDGPVKVPPT